MLWLIPSVLYQAFITLAKQTPCLHLRKYLHELILSQSAFENIFPVTCLIENIAAKQHICWQDEVVEPPTGRSLEM